MAVEMRSAYEWACIPAAGKQRGNLKKTEDSYSLERQRTINSGSHLDGWLSATLKTYHIQQVLPPRKGVRKAFTKRASRTLLALAVPWGMAFLRQSNAILAITSRAAVGRSIVWENLCIRRTVSPSFKTNPRELACMCLLGASCVTHFTNNFQALTTFGLCQA